MKKLFQITTGYTSKINPNQIRIMWLILTLLLFVLGAGAPENGAGWTGG